jgi:ribosomal protein S27AE
MFITNKYDADKGRKYCSMECRRLHTSKKKELYRDIAHYLRTHSLYDKWRLKVMENANFKCQQCGNGSNLQAHHKKRLYDIAEQYEFNIEKILESEEFNDDQNGVCLCEKCHTKEHPHMKIQQIKNCRPKLKLLKA